MRPANVENLTPQAAPKLQRISFWVGLFYDRPLLLPQ